MLSEKPWRPDQVLLLLIRLLASIFIGGLLVSLLDATHWLESKAMEVATLAIGMISFHGAALVLIHWSLRACGVSWEQAFGFLAPRLGRALLLGLLVILGILPVALSLQHLSFQVMELVHLHPEVQSPVQMLQTTDTLPMKLLLGFMAVLVAPVAEELVFRGVIYPTVKQLGFPKLALWGTSILFAAVHLNLVIFLPLTFLAIVLALLYEATDNLLAPIFAHGVFNFVNFLWVIVSPSGSPSV